MIDAHGAKRPWIVDAERWAEAHPTELIVSATPCRSQLAGDRCSTSYEPHNHQIASKLAPTTRSLRVGCPPTCRSTATRRVGFSPPPRGNDALTLAARTTETAPPSDPTASAGHTVDGCQSARRVGFSPPPRGNDALTLTARTTETAPPSDPIASAGHTADGCRSARRVGFSPPPRGNDDLTLAARTTETTSPSDPKASAGHTADGCQSARRVGFSPPPRGTTASPSQHERRKQHPHPIPELLQVIRWAAVGQPVGWALAHRQANDALTLAAQTTETTSPSDPRASAGHTADGCRSESRRASARCARIAR